MPEFDVVIRYRLEYVGTKSVKAANEEEAQEQVQAQLGKIVDLASFESYIDENGDIEESEAEIEEVNEL